MPKNRISFPDRGEFDEWYCLLFFYLKKFNTHRCFLCLLWISDRVYLISSIHFDCLLLSVN